MGRIDAESETLIPTGGSFDVAGTLTGGASAGGHGRFTSADAAAQNFLVAHSLRADGFDASEDGTGRGTPIVPTIAPCLTQNYGKQPDNSDTNAGPMLVADTLRGHPRPGSNSIGATAISFRVNDYGGDTGTIDQAPTLRRQGVQGVQGVRRLTPVECERLQGFPDDYTLIPYRSKIAADGPRYKALGNSMAVPVMGWIGRRIQMVDAIEEERLTA